MILKNFDARATLPQFASRKERHEHNEAIQLPKNPEVHRTIKEARESLIRTQEHLGVLLKKPAISSSNSTLKVSKISKNEVSKNNALRRNKRKTSTARLQSKGKLKRVVRKRAGPARKARKVRTAKKARPRR
jgi:hypothetical protein